MKRFAAISMCVAFCLASTQGSGAAVSYPSPDTATITFTRSVPKGSADFDRIRAFLLDQANKGAPDSGSASGLSPDKLGNFTMRSVRYRAIPAKPERDKDVPVIPTDEKMPAEGDSWIVSSCAGNLFQSWTWTYGNHGWAPTGRAMDSRSDCKERTESPST